MSADPRRSTADLVGGSLAAAAAANALRETRRGRPPAAGDLFVLRAAADFPLEWAVVQTADSPPRALVVPADPQPAAAPADLALAPEAPAAPLTLRCGWGCWVPLAWLEEGLRTGALAPADAARAAERRREMEAGLLPPAETGPGSAAREWLEDVVAPAQAALLAAAAGTQSPARPGRPAAGLPRSGRFRRQLLGLAASAVLALGAGWWLASLANERALAVLRTEAARQRQQAERATAAERQAAGERDRLARELARAGAAAEAWQRQLAAREKPPAIEAPRADGQINLPLLYLTRGEALRGGEGNPRPVDLPTGAQFVAVLVSLDGPWLDFPEYRLALYPADGDAALWQRDGLRRGALDQLVLLLPRKLLATGRYRLHLAGLAGREARPLADFPLAFAAR